MQRSAVLRGLAVLALLSSGACDTVRSPTTVEVPQAPHFSTYPSPAPTVSNSGGYPLLSWSDLAGATSYSIVLRKHRTEIDKATLASESEEFHYALGSTAGTSFLDTANAYTGKSTCRSSGTYKTVILFYTYLVTATFPDGTSTGSVAAPVAPC